VLRLSDHGEGVALQARAVTRVLSDRYLSPPNPRMQPTGRLGAGPRSGGTLPERAEGAPGRQASRTTYSDARSDSRGAQGRCDWEDSVTGPARRRTVVGAVLRSAGGVACDGARVGDRASRWDAELAMSEPRRSGRQGLLWSRQARGPRGSVRAAPSDGAAEEA
jgi:hypothetical protein